MQWAPYEVILTETKPPKALHLAHVHENIGSADVTIYFEYIAVHFIGWGYGIVDIDKLLDPV